MSRYNKKHGLYNSKIYRVWHLMKCRCYNPNNLKYYRYGKRGIIVCDEWKDNFITFYKWAIENGYKEGLSIDRIDNNGNYEPDNCRWVDRFRQANNTRRNIFIEYNGEKHTISEWSRIIGVSADCFRWRFKKYGICEKVFLPCNIKFRNKLYRLHDVSSK